CKQARISDLSWQRYWEGIILIINGLLTKSPRSNPSIKTAKFLLDEYRNLTLFYFFTYGVWIVCNSTIFNGCEKSSNS
ncbi:TPA: hypothetical protein ACG0BA_004740, partial [Serratia odorifera]